MARDYDAHQWLTAPVIPNQYKPDLGAYADDFFNYANQRSDKRFEQNLEQERLKREQDRDRNADERDRISQEQHARQILMGNERDKEREALYGRQEERRQSDAMFERNQQLQRQHEALIQELWHAINDPGQDAATRQNRIRAAQDALHRAGYGTQAVEQTPSGSVATPVQQSAVAPRRAPSPMTRDQESTSAALDRADATYSKGLGAKPGLDTGTDYKSAKSAADAAGRYGVDNLGGGRWRPTTEAEDTAADRDNASRSRSSKRDDAKLDTQLDGIDKTYTEGLTGKTWLPGQSPVPSRRRSADVVRSDAMLDPDDPYNQLVK